MSQRGQSCENKEVYCQEREKELSDYYEETRKHSSLRAIYVNLSSINIGEKGVRLIAKQGESYLTLSYSYMNLFISYRL